MKIYQLKCPSCNATVEIDPNKKIMFCMYCGQKIYIDDEIKHIKITKDVKFHKTYTDEARIKENDSNEKIRLKELEYKHKEKKRDDIASFLYMGILLFIILFSFARSYYYSEKEKPKENEIMMSISSNDIIGEDYKLVKKELENSGFYNIECIATKDLITGWIDKEGEVEKISINGNSKFKKGDIFSKDSKILITYHSF